LSDKEKKNLYDSGVDDNAAQGFGGFEGFDLFDLMGGGSRKSRQKKVKDTEFAVKLTLKDSFLGRTKTFNVKREIICHTCLGKGAKSTSLCKKCGGKGEIAIKRQMGFMFSVQHATCDGCNGEGSKIEGPSCSECKGSRYLHKTESITVEFKRGFENGEQLVVKGKGDEHVGCVTGDLVLTAEITEDALFKRKGNNLILKVDIDLRTILFGGQINFKHLDGTNLNVQVDKLKNLRNDVYMLKNMGIQGGNLYIDPVIKVSSNDLQKLHKKSEFYRDSIRSSVVNKIPENETKQEYSRESIFSQFFSGF